MNFNFIDFFSGAGGLSVGLEMAGFQPLMAIEIEKVYSNTYQKNHPKTKVLNDDIKSIDGKNILKDLHLKVGELDLIAGGPPCQGFSINAPIRSLDDQRNHLIKEYLRIVEDIKPKVVLIENVPGIVSLGKGSVVELIYKELEKMGYQTDHRILFAGHYGVPQTRFRTIFLASRKDVQIDFPSPTHQAQAVANFTGAKELCIPILPLFSGFLKPQTSVWDAISDLPPIEGGEINESLEYLDKPKSDYQSNLRQGSASIHNHICAKLGKVNLDRLKHIPQGGSWRDIPHELLPKGMQRARRSDHTKRYGRLHPDSLCSTILTKCDPHWGSFFHPTQDRVLSVREAARIQSFPDKYVFYGNLTQQYEQVGNAVPPLMAKAIGDEIMKALVQTKCQRKIS